MNYEGCCCSETALLCSRLKGSHKPFGVHHEIAINVRFDILRKTIQGSTDPVSIAISTTSISDWLSSTTQGRCLNCHKNTKEWFEYCGSCMHENVFRHFINILLLVTNYHVSKI